MNFEILQRKIISDENYYKNIYEKKFGKYVKPEFVSSVFDTFFSHPEYVINLSRIKEIDKDIILLNDTFKLKIVNTIISCHLFNLEDIDACIVENDKNYLEKLSNDVYNTLLLANFDDFFDNSLFLSSPMISNILYISNYIKKEILKLPLNPWTLELKNILDSTKSLLILFNNGCFSQAMAVFRQAVEQYIILKCLNIYPEAKMSFLAHQDITIRDATGVLSKEELDDYIKENNLTYNNYKSYLNYGWLDSIEDFRRLKEENPRTKYSIKTVSQVANIPDFYEAMDFASNYVHSNFVFVDVKWNIVISEVIDGLYDILDMIIDMIDIKYVVNGFDFLDLYENIKNMSRKIIGNEELDYHIEL